MGTVRRLKLTKSFINSVSAESQTDYWDTDIRGLGLRVSPGGSKAFFLRYRPKQEADPARPKRFMTLGPASVLSPEQARRRAQEALGEVAKGGDPARRKKVEAGLSVSAVCDRFLREHVEPNRSRNTLSQYRTILNGHVVPKLGKRLIGNIERLEIVRLHAGIPNQVTANRAVQIFAAAYSWAHRTALIPTGENPAKGIALHKEKGRTRCLSDAEIHAFFETLKTAEREGLSWPTGDKQRSKHASKPKNRVTVLGGDVVAAFKLLLFTGARLREILNLKWDDVDLKNGVLHLRQTKTGYRTVALAEPVSEILSALERHGDYVVSGDSPDRPRSDLKRPWRLICHNAKLKNVRIHDLRHTAGSHLAMENQSLAQIGEILGHSSPRTTMKYVHFLNESKKQASEKLAIRLLSAVGASSGNDPASQ